MDQSPQGFASEDEEATYCLSLLRDGDRHQQIVARERLSQIFERRGMLDEAAQCLESNIREGVRDPRVYQRLAGVYRRQGRHELADEVLVEARRLAERMTRPPQQGGRRAISARPPRPVPGTPPPDSRDVSTAQMPAAPSPIPTPPQSGSGGELELDWTGGRTGAEGEDLDDAEPPLADRPWWLSPGMVVLLILLCGPYGLALMWVRGGYTKPTKVRVTTVWAGLMVLILAGAAVSIQSQLGALIAGSASLAGGSRLGAPPTPMVFGTPLPKPQLPPGLAAAPPTPAVSPGALGTRPAGVSIQPAPATKPEDEEEMSPEDEEEEQEDGPSVTSSPTPGPGSSASAPSPKPDGEQVKVSDAGAGGVNMRERPGPTGPVIKSVPEGTVLRIVGPDQQMDGKAWRNVRDDTGSTGWIVAELLEPA